MGVSVIRPLLKSFLQHKHPQTHATNLQGVRAGKLEVARYRRQDVSTVSRTLVGMDSAFFSDEIVSMPDSQGVEFSISVQFGLFTALKALVENRKRWHRLNGQWHFFESQWKPLSWNHRYRFVCIRTKNRKQHKGAIQLDLFIPCKYGYDFKVIITNKSLSAKKNTGLPQRARRSGGYFCLQGSR